MVFLFFNLFLSCMATDPSHLYINCPDIHSSSICSIILWAALLFYHELEERKRERERKLYLPSQRKYYWIKTSSWLNSSRKSVTSCTTVEEVVVVCCQNWENFTTSVPHNAIVIFCDSDHLIVDRKYFMEDLSGMSPEIFLFGNHYIV